MKNAEIPSPLDSSETSDPLETRIAAEQALLAARTAGDPRRIVVARVDLGLVMAREGDAAGAVRLMEPALVEARRLSDLALETDVLIHLGRSLLAAGQTVRAQQTLERAIETATTRGDRSAETLALESLARVLFRQGDRMGGRDRLEQAVILARATGDLRHEAELLWALSIEASESTEPVRAARSARAAVDLFRRLNHPQATWYADHLMRYEASLGVTPERPEFEPTIETKAWIASPSSPPPVSSGPTWLRMAVTASASLARFAASGFRPTSAETLEERLATCRVCPEHTGIRCRVCGCFTAAKARLVHESCPIGRWSS